MPAEHVRARQARRRTIDGSATARHPICPSAARSRGMRFSPPPSGSRASRPPEGAPNVLLIITDDVGFGAPCTFGGVIPTQRWTRLRPRGLSYTSIHSTALCSPTRAALITGRNHHSVGFGVISEQATGYPGYDSVIIEGQGDDRARCCWTTATTPRGSARTTTRRASRPARPGPSTSGQPAWASSISTASWAATPTSGQPNLFRNTTQIYPFDETGREWNLITAMADDAIGWITDMHQIDPSKPFLVNYAPGGTHAPHHPTPGVDREDRGR